MTKQDKVCFLCLKKDVVELCSSCGLVYQCEDHASYHQDKRNNVCFPFKVTEDEGVGKYIIAVRYVLCRNEKYSQQLAEMLNKEK